MVSKLPRWAWLGGWALAFIAGMVNVVGFSGFEHQAITHLTGTTTMLASAVATRQLQSVLHFACAISAFLAGAVLSGFLIQHRSLQLGRPYGVVLALESIMLWVAVPLFEHSSAAGLYLAAAACGLQNAMVSTFSGAAIRTTHLSGMFTDLGLFLGHALRGIPVDKLRLKLSAQIISAFFGGGLIGALAFARFGYRTLMLPAALTGCSAAAYAVYSWSRKSHAPEAA